MKDLLCEQFQETVGEYLIRHKSVLDVMAKLQEATARTNRAIAKAVTTCGCIKINASKQQVPPDSSLSDVRQHMSHHVEGGLCEQCREIVEAELGQSLFYVTAVCNVLGLNLSDILQQEQKKLTALGVFNFS